MTDLMDSVDGGLTQDDLMKLISYLDNSGNEGSTNAQSYGYPTNAVKVEPFGQTQSMGMGGYGNGSSGNSFGNYNSYNNSPISAFGPNQQGSGCNGHKHHSSPSSQHRGVPSHFNHPLNPFPHHLQQPAEANGYSHTSPRNNGPMSPLFSPASPAPAVAAAAAAAAANQPANQLLEDIYQFSMRQREQLEKVRTQQKQVLTTGHKELFELMDEQHKLLKNQLDSELKALSHLRSSVLLAPSELYRLQQLVQELRVQLAQLELYHQELLQFAQPQLMLASRPVLALVVVEQPFPMVITKGKTLDDDPVVVQLLAGAAVDIASYSKVKVAVVSDAAGSGSGSGGGGSGGGGSGGGGSSSAAKGLSTAKALETDTQPLDAHRRTAKWHLKFLNGTRKNTVALKFGIQVQLAMLPPAGGSPTPPQMVTVESANTQPFIVITNECQWEESEGILLKRDTYPDPAVTEVPWPQFANVLQRHFLRATRQDIAKPTRCLSVSDLNYIHDKFFNCAPAISQRAFDAFWTWFGKAMHKLRYQRHIGPMFQTGLIYGFISREGVNEALENEEVGSFLIRLSERHPGLFAVGYKIEDSDPAKRVRHYLVRPDDTAGAKKTLPDFLNECSTFTYLLQVTGESPDGKPILRKFAKDVVLEQYYSKRNVLPPLNGYDDTLPVPSHAMAN